MGYDPLDLRLCVLISRISYGNKKEKLMLLFIVTDKSKPKKMLRNCGLGFPKEQICMFSTTTTMIRVDTRSVYKERKCVL